MEGKLIVVEGLDGSGKSTQIALLKDFFDNKGIENKFIHFPMMNQGVYGKLIAQFLRGEFGSVESVHPKLVALLFANDRKEHIKMIEEWLSTGYIVFADRYVNSNIAFQCAKTVGAVAKESLKEWILDFEYSTNELPKPYRSIYLDVPFDFVQNSLNKVRTGEDRSYLEGATDIHEDSLELQLQVMMEYKKMVIEQEDFLNMTCTTSEGLFLDAETINKKIIDVLNLHI